MYTHTYTDICTHIHIHICTHSHTHTHFLTPRNEKVHGRSQRFHVFVEDVDGENLLHSELFLLKEQVCVCV
jgi:hypothetical protein